MSVQQLAVTSTKQKPGSRNLTAINKHFKKLGIPRDLSAKIEAKAAAMVSAAMVSGKVSIDGTETLPAEAAIINSAATTSANVLFPPGRHPAAADAGAAVPAGAETSAKAIWQNGQASRSWRKRSAG